MDSSDSEDDCYGNIAQKLQRMKNKYSEDKIESTNLLNESTEIDEILKKAGKSAHQTEPIKVEKKKSDASSDKDDDDSISIETIIAMSSKRITRSSTKRSSTDVTLTPGQKKTKKRKKKSELSNPETNTSSNTSTVVENQQNTSAVVETQQNTSAVVENQQNTSRSRGRPGNRGRGRNRGRNNRQPYSNLFSIYPTYSVGNTDEYPDQSDSQQLFSSKKPTNDVIIIEENETLDENEELSVKVYWQSSEFFKFTIRKFQKLSQIFDYFSKKENVSIDKLFFTFNDQILKPDDTPDSISYSIAKFIDGGIVNQSVSKLVKNSKDDKNGIKLKFQCQNVKKPFETTIGLDEKLSVAMMKCAEHFETLLDKLRFQFDGDVISGKTTARDLDLEGGECIDVVIIS